MALQFSCVFEYLQHRRYLKKKYLCINGKIVYKSMAYDQTEYSTNVNIE